MSPWNNNRVSPAQIITLGFILLILAGTLLLMLPFAARSGQATPFGDALFTATSATCVTGLVINDTYTYWSPFGQVVILLLIQAGGMGVVTLAVAVSIVMGKRIGLKQRFVMQEAISAPHMGGIVRMTGFIIRATLICEGIGAVLLALRFCPEMGLGRGLWYAIFHAVSAFCNAGFDLMGRDAPFSSLTAFSGDGVVILTIAALIVIGGIGFLAWDDVKRHRLHLRAYRLQTKLVLVVTALLLVLPALYFFFYEFNLPQWQGMPLGQRILNAVFQSVTPRTAGFNSVDLTLLSAPAILLTIALMLVGGSSGSTAGGFKTTSLAMLFLSIRAVLRRQDSIQIFRRRIPPDVLRCTVAIVMLYILLFLAGSFLLCCIDGVPMSAAMFECASAVGTVGLSLGITPELGAASRFILIALMVFGRVGGLTMLYALSSSQAPAPSQLPQEKVAVG